MTDIRKAVDRAIDRLVGDGQRGHLYGTLRPKVERFLNPEVWVKAVAAVPEVQELLAYLRHPRVVAKRVDIPVPTPENTAIHVTRTTADHRDDFYLDETMPDSKTHHILMYPDVTITESKEPGKDVRVTFRGRVSSFHEELTFQDRIIYARLDADNVAVWSTDERTVAIITRATHGFVQIMQERIEKEYQNDETDY